MIIRTEKMLKNAMEGYSWGSGAGCNMSPSYLSTRFKKETGASFTEYLIRYRVNKAKNLLKEKQNRCREVAENVGYKDYAQFSKIFKKYVGLSPKEYQRMALEEENQYKHKKSE